MIAPTPWEDTMTAEEVRWCWQELETMAREMSEPCVDNYRAARIWKSSQRRRFRRQKAKGCCGSIDWVAKRWSPEKGRWDLYLLGFNFGH